MQNQYKNRDNYSEDFSFLKIWLKLHPAQKIAKLEPWMWHIEMVTLHMIAILSLTFILLEHFLSFKMALYSFKLNAIWCYKWNTAGNTYYFLYYNREVNFELMSHDCKFKVGSISSVHVFSLLFCCLFHLFLGSKKLQTPPFHQVFTCCITYVLSHFNQMQ